MLLCGVAQVSGGPPWAGAVERWGQSGESRRLLQVSPVLQSGRWGVRWSLPGAGAVGRWGLSELARRLWEAGVVLRHGLRKLSGGRRWAGDVEAWGLGAATLHLAGCLAQWTAVRLWGAAVLGWWLQIARTRQAEL